jgi:hypothetical protein
MRQQPAVMDGRVHAQQDGHLDGTRRVEPAVRAPTKRRFCIGIVDRDGDRARARFPLEGIETGMERVERFR